MVPHPQIIPQNIAGKFVPPDPGATQPIVLVDCGGGSAFSRWGRGLPLHLTQCGSCGNRARAALEGIEVEGLAGLGKGTSTGATATLSAPW
jgi:hypothetical protein